MRTRAIIERDYCYFMQTFSISPKTLIASCWKNRELIIALAKREVASRYKGSTFGILWSFIHPIFMLAVYTFVFSVVFKARWDAKLESKTEFAMVLFVGLIIFNLFSECIGRAPTLITQNANYVKKVVFPLEVLPCIALGAALFQAVMNLAVWFFFYSVFFGVPHIESLLIPLVITPFVLMTLGLSWLLSSLGAFLRDLSQIVSMSLMVLMFLSPIFYPVSALPEKFQVFLKINPLTLTIEQARGLLVYGTLPSLTTLIIQLVVASIGTWLCFAWFQRSRRAFADVI